MQWDRLYGINRSSTAMIAVVDRFQIVRLMTTVVSLWIALSVDALLTFCSSFYIVWTDISNDVAFPVTIIIIALGCFLSVKAGI